MAGEQPDSHAPNLVSSAEVMGTDAVDDAELTESTPVSEVLGLYTTDDEARDAVAAHVERVNQDAGLPHAAEAAGVVAASAVDAEVASGESGSVQPADTVDDSTAEEDDAKIDYEHEKPLRERSPEALAAWLKLVEAQLAHHLDTVGEDGPGDYDHISLGNYQRQVAGFKALMQIGPLVEKIESIDAPAGAPYREAIKEIEDEAGVREWELTEAIQAMGGMEYDPNDEGNGPVVREILEWAAVREEAARQEVLDTSPSLIGPENDGLDAITAADVAGLSEGALDSILGEVDEAQMDTIMRHTIDAAENPALRAQLSEKSVTAIVEKARDVYGEDSDQFRALEAAFSENKEA